MARQVVVEAQEFARADGHAEITVWDLLVGLRKTDGVSGTILAMTWPDVSALEVSVRNLPQIQRMVGQHATVGQLPFSQASKRVLEQSLRHALQRGYDFIGTEHILLSLCEVCPDSALVPNGQWAREAADAIGLPVKGRSEAEVRSVMELPEVEEAQAKARYEVIRIAAPEFIVVIDGVVQGDPGRPFIFYDEQHAHESGRKWTA